MRDFERASEPTYEQMASTYKDWFSTGYLSSMQDKLALIDLIGWLVTTLRKKKPDVTYYQVVYKLAQSKGLSDKEIKSIAIIAEDFAYGCDDFVTFGLTIKEVPAKIREIIHKMLPF